jgi:hypothetical protein
VPVTIGPFTDVPAPNDPVASPWAQHLTQFAVDQISSGPTAPTNPDAELWYDTSDTGVSLPNGAYIQRGTYTPTLTGMAVGTGGINTAEYVYVGGANVGDYGTLSVRGNITLGTSGFTVPTTPSWLLPTGFAIDSTTHDIGTAIIQDITALQCTGFMWPLGTNGVRPLCIIISGTTPYHDTLSPTKPFTWATGDKIFWTVNTHAQRA